MIHLDRYSAIGGGGDAHVSRRARPVDQPHLVDMAGFERRQAFDGEQRLAPGRQVDEVRLRRRCQKATFELVGDRRAAARVVRLAQPVARENSNPDRQQNRRGHGDQCRLWCPPRQAGGSPDGHHDRHRLRPLDRVRDGGPNRLDHPFTQPGGGIALIDGQGQQGDSLAQLVSRLAMLEAGLQVRPDVQRLRCTQGIEGVGTEEVLGLGAAQGCDAVTPRACRKLRIFSSPILILPLTVPRGTPICPAISWWV